VNRSFLFFAVCIGWVCAAHLQAQEVPFVELKGHTNEVISAVFSPDGTKVVTAGGDGFVRIWDAETGKELKALEKHAGSPNSAAFSPDGKRIITSNNNVARIWDANSIFP